MQCMHPKSNDFDYLPLFHKASEWRIQCFCRHENPFQTIIRFCAIKNLNYIIDRMIYSCKFLNSGVSVNSCRIPFLTQYLMEGQAMDNNASIFLLYLFSKESGRLFLLDCI